MNTHIKLPPLRRPQVPRIDADIDLMDIRRLADWCEKTARSYARSAVESATAQLRQQLADTQAKLDEALAREEAIGAGGVDRKLHTPALQSQVRALEADNHTLVAEIDELKRRAGDQEPFGYFRAEPFGWTDCTATDEGAIALYERPQAKCEPVNMPSDDALDDALSNLEHDNYEQSYSGYKNRQADIGLIRAAIDADRKRRGEPAAMRAMAELKAAIHADPSYAWTWHCAVWAAAHDEGLETGAANRAAARLMHMAFDLDTTKHPNFAPEHLQAAPVAAQPQPSSNPEQLPSIPPWTEAMRQAFHRTAEIRHCPSMAKAVVDNPREVFLAVMAAAQPGDAQHE